MLTVNIILFITQLYNHNYVEKAAIDFFLTCLLSQCDTENKIGCRANTLQVQLVHLVDLIVTVIQFSHGNQNNCRLTTKPVTGGDLIFENILSCLMYSSNYFQKATKRGSHLI